MGLNCSKFLYLSFKFRESRVPNPDQKLTASVSSLASKYEDVAGGLLPLLHEVQEKLGYIPETGVAVIAEIMGLSRAEVHGVIGFYHDFHTQSRGRTVIQVCRAEACQAMGSRELESHAKQRLGIDFGETTDDGRYTLEAVYCLGNCACSPSVSIDGRLAARVDAKRFDELLEGDDA
jgi:formate dehydrogenase subunit gamma